ncbi:MAG: RlmE family RNA methyltransferase [Nitrososphaeria archaeon]
MRPWEARRDLYWRLAKERGYSSRSAFKLLEIQRKFGIMRRGDKVVDLGCHPGGWVQVAAKAVGPEGLVVGVDLKETRLEPRNSVFVRADVDDPGLVGILRSYAPFGYDVLLSDLSPNISGAWELDSFRQISLSNRALELARELLKEGGNSVFKVFQGDELGDFLGSVRRSFEEVRVVKPRASRPRSSELYVVALGRRRLGN